MGYSCKKCGEELIFGECPNCYPEKEVKTMSENRPKEVQGFFDEIKHFIMTVVPDTFSGYLLFLIINVGVLKINSTEFMVGVAKTGIYVFVLVLARYLAMACRMFINYGISLNNQEVR